VNAPTEALVPIMKGSPHAGLPAEAQTFLERERVPFVDAYRFIGIERSAAYTMARRYIRRTARLVKSGKPFSIEELRPKRDSGGRWHEIPAYQIGNKYLCRTELIVGMVYPEWGARP
jgi:hypothetical protein